MEATQFEAAKKLVPTLKTDSVDAFRQALSAVDFPWTNRDAIEWWKASREERVALEKLVAAGGEQAKCKVALSNFCTPLSLNSAKDAVAGAVVGEFDRSGWLKYYFSEAAQAVAGSATQSPVSDPNAKLVLDIANSFFAKAGGAFYTKRTYDSVNDTAFKQFNTVRDAPPTGVKWTPNGYGLVAVNAPFDYNGTPYVVSQVLTA